MKPNHTKQATESSQGRRRSGMVGSNSATFCTAGKARHWAMASRLRRTLANILSLCTPAVALNSVLGTTHGALAAYGPAITLGGCVNRLLLSAGISDGITCACQT